MIILRPGVNRADFRVCCAAMIRERLQPHALVIDPMSDLIRIFTERGDLAHLALLLWACAASAALWFVLRELAAASRRFDDFVRALELFNRRVSRRGKNRQD